MQPKLKKQWAQNSSSGLSTQSWEIASFNRHDRIWMDWAEQIEMCSDQDISWITGDLVKPEYVLDGRLTTTLRAFYAEISRALLTGQPWGETIDDLDQILRGNYGLVPASFRLIWTHAEIARSALGYAETVEQLTQRLRDCHPTVLIKTAWALRSALREQGPTVYDWLVELMGKHPNVELVLIESEIRSDG
jgi:hypothetical protein